MTAVYIANATKQILHFSYRLPERKTTITQVVPFLRQTKLGPDMSQQDIDSIIEQWGKYGLIKADELESRRGKFQGYMISVGKPVSQAIMDKATKYREMVLLKEGVEFRKTAALAMVNTIEAETKTPATEYEISIAEEIPEGGFKNTTDLHTAEGYRITGDRPNMPEKPSGRRSRRAA